MTKTVKAYVPDEFKTTLTAYLASKGISESSYVKALIEADLPREFELTKQKESLPKESVIRARVTNDEYLAFSQRLESEGMQSRSALLVKIVREYLNNTPSLNQNQMAELREANKNLLGIGRNLNQITKRMNSEGKGGDTVTLTYLSRIIDYVEQQQQAILGIMDFQNSRKVRSSDG